MYTAISHYRYFSLYEYQKNGIVPTALIKVGHLQPSYLYIYRLGSSLGKLPLFGLRNVVRPNIWKTKINMYLSTRYRILPDRNLKCIF